MRLLNKQLPDRPGWLAIGLTAVVVASSGSMAAAQQDQQAQRESARQSQNESEQDEQKEQDKDKDKEKEKEKEKEQKKNERDRKDRQGQREKDNESQRGQAAADRDDQQASKRDGDRRDRQSTMGGRGRAARRGNIRLEPEGWVRVAADYDNDGRYDTIEMIYVYDLERARRESRGRREATAAERGQRPGEQQMAERDKKRPPRGDSQSDRRAKRTQSLSGEISNLKAVNLAGLKRSRWVAKVDTGKRGMATVVLGPKAALSGWDLQKGDQIDVKGVRARLNDRAVLMATRVSHDGQSKKIDLPERMNMKRVKATVRNTREVRFRRFDQPFVIGQVETKSGDREVVNFGPKSKVGELDLQEGDEVRLLVRQGRINGRPVLVAKEIRSGGDRVKIARVKAKRGSRGQDKRREDRSESRKRDKDESADRR